jgi:hypothetical protein
VSDPVASSDTELKKVTMVVTASEPVADSEIVGK